MSTIIPHYLVQKLALHIYIYIGVHERTQLSEIYTFNFGGCK